MPAPPAGRRRQPSCQKPSCAPAVGRMSGFCNTQPHSCGPGGTLENSPALQCWVSDGGRTKSRQGRPTPRANDSVVPAGLADGIAAYPALKCWAILSRPCGTAKTVPHRCKKLSCARAVLPGPFVLEIHPMPHKSRISGQVNSIKQVLNLCVRTFPPSCNCPAPSLRPSPMASNVGTRGGLPGCDEAFGW